MFKANIEKLELAKKEAENIGVIAERAMKKLEEIMAAIDKLEKEEKRIK